MSEEMIAHMSGKLFNKWIKALRSGKYKRGVGLLKDDNNRYCCLGVLCKVAGYPEHMYLYRGLPSTCKIPVSADAAIETNLCGLEILAADMNDKGKSFKKIATWLEENRARIVDRP